MLDNRLPPYFGKARLPQQKAQPHLPVVPSDGARVPAAVAAVELAPDDIALGRERRVEDMVEQRPARGEELACVAAVGSAHQNSAPYDVGFGRGLGGGAEVGDVVGEHLVVAVEKHQPGGRGKGGAGVAGACGAGARLVGDGDVEVGLTVGPPGHDLARRVARAVVDKDNAEVPIRLRPDRGQGASQ